MAKPQIDFGTYLPRIPTKVAPLPTVSTIPILHYKRSANDSWNLLLYVERHLGAANVYPAPYTRHMNSLRVMVFLSLVEAFERFLKETAAICIDEVGGLVLDDRLDVFTIRGNTIASHFAGGSLGKCLCESLTWCDCDDTNKRFRRILKEPFEQAGKFYVFPRQNQQPATLIGRYKLMSILWQLRHSIVHNRGVITDSDARKLRLLCKRRVDGAKVFTPDKPDVWYAKEFLDQLAQGINREVGQRLADLLTTLHGHDSSLFDAGDKAQQLADAFRQRLTVSAQTRAPS